MRSKEKILPVKSPELVNSCPDRIAGIGNCVAYGELAKQESGSPQPDGGAEV